MPKSRASYLKRQREVAKKVQRQAKLQRRLDRKAAADSPPQGEEGEGVDALATPPAGDSDDV
jgi:hypothetical protein